MKNTEWFKDAIIYQIYPRSFKDSNNDGMGDIKGIIEKLDYLADLGINCVWLSPVYESPMDDNGYDISDYKKIHEMFGTMEDFKLMLDEMHKRGIRLIMDLVANHTSDEHEWFKESRKSEDNPYRDYYIWRKKPNNWTGFFGEKAWEYDELTDSYYLHLFGKKQPDVNWENPKVREAYKDIIKFYLDMGVDGFRCDVINLISKDQNYKNGRNPLILVGKKYFINGPRLHEFLHEINTDVLSNYDCMTVGETAFTTLEDARLLTSPERQELNTIFNFDHTNSDSPGIVCVEYFADCPQGTSSYGDEYYWSAGAPGLKKCRQVPDFASGADGADDGDNCVAKPTTFTDEDDHDDDGLRLMRAFARPRRGAARPASALPATSTSAAGSGGW
jgi:oligo-1,6-glucosidase